MGMNKKCRSTLSVFKIWTADRARAVFLFHQKYWGPVGYFEKRQFRKILISTWTKKSGELKTLKTKWGTKICPKR